MRKNNMAINTVIFDIGNVLTEFSWERHFRQLGFEGEIFERVADATVRGPYWGEFDRGRDENEVLAGFIEMDPGVEEQIRLMFKNIAPTLNPVDYAIPWIMDLKKKGYRVLILSNLSSKTVYECHRCLHFMNYVDGGILSFMEGVIKPEREIYDRLIERYFIEPSEAVFIDDTQRNIDMALKVGLHGIVFENYEQAKRDLEAMLADG